RRIVEREVIPVLMVIRQHPGATAIENAAQRAPVLGVVIGNALANFRRDQTERIKTDIEVDLVAGEEGDIRTHIERAAFVQRLVGRGGMAAIAVAEETTAKADHKGFLARAGQTTRQRGKITGTQILPVWRHHARDTLDPATATHLTAASRRQLIKGTQRIEALEH